MSMQPLAGRSRPDSLADVLERVLDKGVVIAGDIVVNVLDIELLSLKLRLFIASAQTAQEMGMDWWTRDAFFTSQNGEGNGSARSRLQGWRDDQGQVEAGDDDLRDRVAALERALSDANGHAEQRSESSATRRTGGHEGAKR
jgi:hypothetical protein